MKIHKKSTAVEVATISSYIVGVVLLTSCLPFAAHGVSHLMPQSAFAIEESTWREWATLAALLTLAPMLMGPRFYLAPFVAFAFSCFVATLIAFPFVGFVAIKVLLLKYGSISIASCFLAVSLLKEEEDKKASDLLEERKPACTPKK